MTSPHGAGDWRQRRQPLSRFGEGRESIGVGSGLRLSALSAGEKRDGWRGHGSVSRLISPCYTGDSKWRRDPSPNLERDADRLAEKTGS